MAEYVCRYCGRVCTNAGGNHNHEQSCEKNPDRIHRQSWNNGKTKETDERIKQMSDDQVKRHTGYLHYQDYLNDNSIAWGQQNMQCYKKYFLEEQEHKCAICGCIDIWQNKPLMFVLDHIDGNSDNNNNNRDNLRLVCPNCDSQLDTFKSKNKHSARAKHRNIKIVTEEEFKELTRANE